MATSERVHERKARKRAEAEERQAAYDERVAKAMGSPSIARLPEDEREAEAKRQVDIAQRMTWLRNKGE